MASAAPATSVATGARGVADDRLLIARVLGHDQQAERLLYERYVTLVYQSALRMVQQDTWLAQECTQEVFLRAFERLHQFRGEASLATWLRHITFSVVCNMLKRERRYRATEISCDPITLEAMVVTPESSSDGWESSAGLARALATLPMLYRTVLLLHDVDGLRHATVAARLGITVTASKVRLSRARAHMRRLLGETACA